MPALYELLRLPEADSERRRYGKAFESAVYVLLQTCAEGKCNLAAAVDCFKQEYGENEYVYDKLLKLLPWASRVANVQRAPTAVISFTEPIYVTADFIVDYKDKRKEIVELKSHVLRKDEWRIATEWRFAARVMRLAYRRSGYDYPVRLIYFTPNDVEHEVVDKIDENLLRKVLARRVLL